MRTFGWVLAFLLIFASENSWAWRCCKKLANGGGDAPGTFLTQDKCRSYPTNYVYFDGVNCPKPTPTPPPNTGSGSTSSGGTAGSGDCKFPTTAHCFWRYRDISGTLPNKCYNQQTQQNKCVEDVANNYKNKGDIFQKIKTEYTAKNHCSKPELKFEAKAGTRNYELVYKNFGTMTVPSDEYNRSCTDGASGDHSAGDCKPPRNAHCFWREQNSGAKGELSNRCVNQWAEGSHCGVSTRTSNYGEPLYSDIEKAFKAQKKCGNRPIKLQIRAGTKSWIDWNDRTSVNVKCP